jgi:TPR repeat protein
MADFEAAIHQLEEDLNITPEDHLSRAGRLHSLAAAYKERFRRTNNKTDLDQSIQLYQGALDIIPEDYPGRSDILQNLGAVYETRSRRIDDKADLDQAIRLYQEALDIITPESYLSRSDILQSLGAAYETRSQRTDSKADLDQSVQLYQDALDITPEDHPDQSDILQSLGALYKRRARRTHNKADIEKSIQLYQEAVDKTPKDHPDRGYRFCFFGAAYKRRFEITGNKADLDQSIQLYQEALDKTPEDYPSRGDILSGLGVAYQVQFQRTNNIADLEQSIRLYQEALDITPKDDLSRNYFLQLLGDIYTQHFKKTNTRVYLEQSIRLYQEALDITPEDHPDRSNILVNLGDVYEKRSQRTNDNADLKQCIQFYREALDRTPKDHPDRASRLQYLGAVYGTRFRKTNAKAHLEQSIRFRQEALDITPEDDSSRALQIQGLGNAYRQRFRKTNRKADLEQAIRLCQEALNITPKDHPSRANRLQILGAVFEEQFWKTDAMADIDQSITLYQEALDITPEGHSHRAFQLQCLGNAYRKRFRRTNAIIDLERSIQLHQKLLNESSFPVSTRIRAGKCLIKIHAASNNWSQAYQAASQTLSLIPLLTPYSLENSDKQHLLTKTVGLASGAAAVALLADKTPYEAIRLLELGRGVIAGALDEMRADIPELQQKHPQLAAEYINLRDQLDAPKTLTQPQVDQRYNAGRKLEEMIQTIRTLSGFDRFLLAPSEDELKSAAKDGPIVVINISKYRCDALIIENSRLRSLELPRLHFRNIQDHTLESLAAPEMLEQLWEAVAQPVLDTLGFTQSPSDGCWPRIWWIPTGPLNKFPLHAAGRHTDGCGETVLDRVMSSYSSSVKAIIHGRRQQRNLGGTLSAPAPALLVAMKHTPGSSKLPFATEEVEMLHDLCRSMAIESVEPRRCKQDIMSHLPHCNIFHFAGHGYTDNDDPLKSYLLLEDGKSNALTVANLLELNLRKHAPFLAYLSACGTGRINGEKFIDENIHLISACQLAGYRHVIGTLWEVKDEICVEMARITYEGIRDRGMTDESVAWGLHNAARELRDRWLSMPGKAKRGSKLAREEDASLGVDEVGADCANDGDQRDARLPRDIVSCDDDDKEVGLWVPYVHFGV